MDNAVGMSVMYYVMEIEQRLIKRLGITHYNSHDQMLYLVCYESRLLKSYFSL